MTIRFAPARNRNPFAAVMMRSWEIANRRSAANDDGPAAANDEALLVEALRHFGSHGLRAARAAADSAMAARAAGQGEDFDRWLSVCRMLDRRLADAICAESACAG